MKNTYSFSETIRDTYSAMMTRKHVVVVLGLTIALFTASLYLNVLFALSVIEHASRQMSTALIRQISMSITPNVISNEGFTERVRNEIKSIRGVVLVDEFYEVSVNIRKQKDMGGIGRQTVIESAGQADPTFEASMLICGRVFMDDKEIVLGKTLADNLSIDVPGQQVISNPSTDRVF